jgi:vancomycin resistance protein YoaR
MSNTHDARQKKIKNPALHNALFSAFVLFVLTIGIYASYRTFEQAYEGKIYPNVQIGGISFGGSTRSQVQQYWQTRNAPFTQATIELRFENLVATVSGDTLDAGYDATLSATQAYEVGRSGHIFADLLAKFFTRSINLSPYFRWNTTAVDDLLANFSTLIDIPARDALFQFKDGKVTQFQTSIVGRQVDIPNAKKLFNQLVQSIPNIQTHQLEFTVSVVPVMPSISTEKVNSFGIKELIGKGYSEFAGSIPGRIHNVILAASRINGVLIPPGKTFSFNETVGDISAATGYQSAYIIKDGKTVLGDGGGVCQVSSTLFRAALAAGLPIVERHAHAYRVHYYEEGGFKPGLDATVFGPTVDLKFTNDTPSYILIQTIADAKNLSLAFELYGTSDGRNAEILNQKLWGVTPPPPDMYQDDPTLSAGVVKQVDFAAWGAKASFDYKVTRGAEVLENTTFYSNFQPWQAVYLRGTKTN